MRSRGICFGKRGYGHRGRGNEMECLALFEFVCFATDTPLRVFKIRNAECGIVKKIYVLRPLHFVTVWFLDRINRINKILFQVKNKVESHFGYPVNQKEYPGDIYLYR